MKIIKEVKKLTLIIQKLKSAKKSIGFVPTMGALHLGHQSLIQAARQENDFVVVSIYVNPLQFGAGEDFKKYPRPQTLDLRFCRKLGVDLVFIPDNTQIYPKGYVTYIDSGRLSNLLCGIKRLGHFRGVATIVIKLLNMIQPQALYLGQKDAQQAIIISHLIKDLNFSVNLRVLPTVREASGLALSSRNIYLSRQERDDATVLFKALLLARVLIKSGQRNSGLIIKRLRELISQKQTARIEYIAIVDTETLLPLKRIRSRCLIALAVMIGKTRLIDNLLVPDVKK